MGSLCLAAQRGQVADVRRLLQQRADVNGVETKFEVTPLMAASAASTKESVAAAATLLVAGADPTIEAPAGVVAAELLSRSKHGNTIGRLLRTFGFALETELESIMDSTKDADEMH